MNNQKDIKTILKEAEAEFEKAFSFFEDDIATLRTGRANPSIVENMMVDSYGSKLPLKQLASISVLGHRTLSIQPWDQSLTLPIEKAILQSDLGINPQVAQNMIKLDLPSLTEEYRKSLAKVLNEKAEAIRVSLRRLREESWRKMQDGFRSGEIREDDKFKGKEDLQNLIDKYNGKVEDLAQRKEKEIMES